MMLVRAEMSTAADGGAAEIDADADTDAESDALRSAEAESAAGTASAVLFANAQTVRMPSGVTVKTKSPFP